MGVALKGEKIKDETIMKSNFMKIFPYFLHSLNYPEETPGGDLSTATFRSWNWEEPLDKAGVPKLVCIVKAHEV